MTASTPQFHDRIRMLSEAITKDAFTDWYRERQIRQNLRDGQPWRHAPDTLRDPERHSPHQLLQCQRKTYYKAKNTPVEDEPPAGIFWAGSRIEEDLIMPFLEDMALDTAADAYVQNSMWVEYEMATDQGALHIRGSTDPVICTEAGDPLLPTEIKTKRSLTQFDQADPTPDRRHKAQLHAYLHGLDQTVSHSLDMGLVIYVDRTQHDLLPVCVEFDSEFWTETVIDWAADQTTYRLSDELPPADPEQQWECEYCSYRQRCGRDDDPFADTPATGFLPLTSYPRHAVVEALEAEGGADALTPTLAYQYPDLAAEAETDVYPWTCVLCGEEYAWDWDELEWDGNPANPPMCPACTSGHWFAELAEGTPLWEDSLHE